MATMKVYSYEVDEEISVPAIWQVCEACGGEGASSAYLGAFTASEWLQSDDFMEDYMKGFYDRTCEICKGRTTVLAPDWAALTDEEDRIVQRHLDDLADMRAEQAAERRAGC
jgi:predicted methyltransferase